MDSVWAQLAVSQSVQYGVPYIDPNTYQPTLDNSAGASLNFAYKPNASTGGTGVLSVGTKGDLTGTDPISLGGQGDSYFPQGEMNSLITGLVPGFTISSSRGTRAIPLVVQPGDFIGIFSGYGALGANAPFAYSELAGSHVYASGASATNCGGEIRWGTKADAGVFTEWIKLDNLGNISPLITGTSRLGIAAKGFGALTLDYTITATVGNVQINKPTGRAIIAGGANQVVVTNNLVTPNSIILCILGAVDATLTSIKAVLAANGNFTVFGNANATGNTYVNFLVINTDS